MPTLHCRAGSHPTEHHRAYAGGVALILTLPTFAAMRDLETYLARAARIEDGAVRIQASGGSVAVWVPVLRPASILDTEPTVLGLRVLAGAVHDARVSATRGTDEDARTAVGDPASGHSVVGETEPGQAGAIDGATGRSGGASGRFLADGTQPEPVDLDAVVQLRALRDRFARGIDRELPIPDERVLADWAGVLPPRGGWTRTGEVSEAELAALAADGIREVGSAYSLPDVSAAAVPATGDAPETSAARPPETSVIGQETPDQRRSRVWSERAPQLDGLPAGVAFGAEALGFLAPRGVQAPHAVIATAGGWGRLTTARGHILVRQRTR